LRGGFAATWVIISDAPVEYPRVIQPDVLVAQAQDSIKRFGDVLKPSGVLIIDSDMVQSFPESASNVYQIPATSIARNELKQPLTANMIMLGALYTITGIVSRKALESAIVAVVPRGKDEVNLRAFDLGAQRVMRV